ncbi:MAG: energy-coupling factor transporter transmembrane protein EcfT [Desulfarculales bacterium]|jgi:energy-coupling factor transport system permease protein|nr:energy-coupling factor transporter transmembrane protein EcfT [Desulfarculales bacterium]
MSGLLDYVPGNTFLHRLHPLSKLIFSFGLCLACFLTQNHWLVLGVIVCSLLQAALAGMLKPALAVLRALSKLSLLLFLAQVFFVRQGQIVLSLPLDIYITDQGLSFSCLFVLRLIAVTLPLFIMLSITRMSDLTNALTRLGLPYKYAFALTTAMRFIPLFGKEMSEIMEAQTARGVEFDSKNFCKKLKLILPLCLPLLLSSVRRIENSAIAAELRGFNVRKKDSGYKRYVLGRGDAAVLGALVLILAAVGLEHFYG